MAAEKKVETTVDIVSIFLMVVIRKKAKTKRSFANMITVIGLHLMSYVSLAYGIYKGYV